MKRGQLLWLIPCQRSGTGLESFSFVFWYPVNLHGNCSRPHRRKIILIYYTAIKRGDTAIPVYHQQICGDRFTADFRSQLYLLLEVSCHYFLNCLFVNKWIKYFFFGCCFRWQFSRCHKWKLQEYALFYWARAEGPTASGGSRLKVHSFDVPGTHGY